MKDNGFIPFGNSVNALPEQRKDIMLDPVRVTEIGVARQIGCFGLASSPRWANILRTSSLPGSTSQTPSAIPFEGAAVIQCFLNQCRNPILVDLLPELQPTANFPSIWSAFLGSIRSQGLAIKQSTCEKTLTRMQQSLPFSLRVAETASRSPARSARCPRRWPGRRAGRPRRRPVAPERNRRRQ